MTPPDRSDIVAATVELQRDTEQIIRLAVNVLRGPDPALRAEAVDKLASLADELADSTARLGELR